jgi:thiamine biosynthesis lipoprotein
MTVAEGRFRVMASSTQVILVDPRPGALSWAESRLRMLEARWSRFIDDSDITRLNQYPGAPVVVDDDTIRLIETMQLASIATDGCYDPTFLHQLLTAGYTASIDDADRITIAIDTRCRTHTVHDVAIDRATSSLTVPQGLSIDPGGIGKGFAADLVVTELLVAGTAGALVSVGGDIAAAGEPPDPDGWRVHIEDPHHPPAVITTLAVSAGGIATSSTRSRRWRHEHTERHHVIDPHTGEQSGTDLAAVSVIANAGWLAEAHATAALLSGSEHVVDYLDAHGLSGLAIDDRGRHLMTRDITIDITSSLGTVAT